MKTSDIPTPLPWEERTLSVWPVPGGQPKYLENLSKVCSWVKKGGLSFDELVTSVGTELNISPVYARNCMDFLRKAGVIQSNDNGVMQLSEYISRWMETKDDNILISVIHSNIRFVGEMLAELDEPKSVQELHDLAAKKYGFNWKANYQEVDNRRNWLMSAKLVERLSDNRMVISDAGRALLNLLERYEPWIFDYDKLERKTLEERNYSPPPR